jgi:hypothetical protein
MFAKSRFGVGAALGGVRHSVVSYGTPLKIGVAHAAGFLEASMTARVHRASRCV